MDRGLDVLLAENAQPPGRDLVVLDALLGKEGEVFGEKGVVEGIEVESGSDLLLDRRKRDRHQQWHDSDAVVLSECRLRW